MTQCDLIRQFQDTIRDTEYPLVDNKGRTDARMRFESVFYSQ